MWIMLPSFMRIRERAEHPAWRSEDNPAATCLLALLNQADARTEDYLVRVVTDE